MAYSNQKPKSVGSGYVNVKKGSDDALIARVAKAVEFLKDNGAYIKLSMRDDNGGYTPLTAFFNNYKENPKDPDIVIRESTVGAPQASRGQSRPQSRPQTKNAAPKVAPAKSVLPTEEAADEENPW